MKLTKPTPLYSVYAELIDLELEDFSELQQIFKTNEPWWFTQYQWGKSFLAFTGRNKSVHTYDRFRNEIERFILWSFIIKKKGIRLY